MKFVRKNLVPNGPGSVKMIPEEPDDLWLSYNLITEGDTVMAVTTLDYHKEGSVLRIRGKNVLENEYVKVGAFHILEIELHRPFVLRKDVWDALALDVLREASGVLSYL